MGVVIVGVGCIGASSLLEVAVDVGVSLEPGRTEGELTLVFVGSGVAGLQATNRNAKQRVRRAFHSRHMRTSLFALQKSTVSREQ